MARPSLIAAFWFGIQLVWGAILAVSLQSRTAELAPWSPVNAYAQLAAIGALVAMVTQLGIGPLSDRLRLAGGDRRIFFGVGVVLSVPAIWFFYGAQSLVELALAFYFLQVAMNVAIGPYQAVIPDYVPPSESGRASAWMAAFQSSGNAAGLLIAGFVHDVRIVSLAIVAALALSYGVTILQIVRVRPYPVTLTNVVIDGPFRTLLASRGLINLGFYTLLGFLFFFVRESLHVADARVPTAICFLAFTLFGVLGAALGGRPSDRYDKRAVVSTANMVIVCALGLLAVSVRPEVAYAGSAFAGLAWGAFFTADWALACTILPKNAMASSMGIWNIASTLPQVLAPMITAPLIAWGDGKYLGFGPRLAIVATIIEFTLGALWLWRLPAVR